MAILSIPDQDKKISDPAQIKDFLQSQNIWFDQWDADVEFDKDADQETILKAYESKLKPFMEKGGYHVADVLNVKSDIVTVPLRNKFLQEHTHTEDEIRFFVDGQGWFWFNPGGEGPVFNVLCERGDLLSVPHGIKHWFDLGPQPFVKAIRIFTDASGWVPDYTGDTIAGNYTPLHKED